MNSGIQFDEMPRGDYNSYGNSSKGLTEMVINLSGGIIKTKKQADYFMLIFALVIIGFSFTLFSDDSDKYSAGAFPVIPAEQQYSF